MSMCARQKVLDVFDGLSCPPPLYHRAWDDLPKVGLGIPFADPLCSFACLSRI